MFQLTRYYVRLASRERERPVDAEKARSFLRSLTPPVRRQAPSGTVELGGRGDRRRLFGSPSLPQRPQAVEE